MDYYAVQISYLVAAGLFIFSLHWMSDPKTARRGVFAGVAGMLIAVLATWGEREVKHHLWVLIPILVAIPPGIWLANIPLTAVPQRTALSHAFGGFAAGLVGAAEYFFYYNHDVAHLDHFTMTAIVLEVILGFLTFTGSLIAAGKLQEVKWIPQRPWLFKGQRIVNITAFGVALIVGELVIRNPGGSWSIVGFSFVILIALAFGLMLVLPIGGADMPTVISILNAFGGLSAVAMGFVLNNKLLITAGALDGSSGMILSIIMCKAMNRSWTNVMFGAFGQLQAASGDTQQKTYRSASAEEAAQIMESAGSVVVVPGYGMAVAQAQHKVRELNDALTKRGVDVKFAIHPVAGRMPGHMNVLLAEADIPYEKLVEMDDINPDMPQTDVALVIGANDVTNPAARHDKSSPIFGMPIIDCDKAHTVMVIKRSMNPGFAGIDNELYYMDKTLMLFGDAKSFVGDIVKELGSSNHH